MFCTIMNIMIHSLSLPMLTSVKGLGFYLHFLFFFHMMSKKLTQLGSPNLMWKCFTMSPGNPFLGSKGQRSRSQVTKTLLAWVFALCVTFLRHTACCLSDTLWCCAFFCSNKSLLPLTDLCNKVPQAHRVVHRCQQSVW